VNDLIYNEATRTVSVFKDFLILDDINEFLKRLYQRSESYQRIPKLAHFYSQQGNFLTPNYFALNKEVDYLLKNIHKKQKLFDELN
jgi:hypothetical protein